MPRACRNFLPGHIWHITQRCHKKEFLLKFRKDKHAWIRWALEAKRRFGLTVLNFMITSNHIHLLAMILASRPAAKHLAPGAAASAAPASASASAISRALQLVESRVAQEFNVRKERRGAFWEGRYHATAVENGPQLARCLTYIDMNMVRAGAVDHPRDWAWCGYHELGRESAGRLSAPAPTPGRRRVSLVDTQALMDLLGVPDVRSLLARRTEWIDIALRKGRLDRDPMWTESVAVGSEKYLRSFQAELESRRMIGVAEIGLGGPDSDSPFLKRTRGNPIFVLGADNEDFAL